MQLLCAALSRTARSRRRERTRRGERLNTSEDTVFSVSPVRRARLSNGSRQRRRCRAPRARDHPPSVLMKSARGNAAAGETGAAI